MNFMTGPFLSFHTELKNMGAWYEFLGTKKEFIECMLSYYVFCDIA